MTALASFLQEYKSSHLNPVNKRIHMVCVPFIEWSLLGVLWCMPRPAVFGDFNWALALMALGLLYYTQFKNLKIILASLSLMAPFLLFVSFRPPYLLETSMVAFVLAWIGQFYGHKVEGKKPSFFRDVFFLLIGPLWVVETLLNKRGSSLL